MIAHKTLRYTLYTAIVVTGLTLTGVFATFQNREVIASTLTLNTVVLISMFLAAGALSASAIQGRAAIRTRLDPDRSETALVSVDTGKLVYVLVNAAISSLLIGVLLVMLLLFNTVVDAGFVFQNFGNLNESAVTLNQFFSLTDQGFTSPLLTANLAGFWAISLSAEFGAIFDLLLVSLIAGVAGGMLAALPRWMRDILLQAAVLTIVIGLIGSQVNQVIALPDALTLLALFVVGYVSGLPMIQQLPSGLVPRLAVSATAGLVLGFSLTLIISTTDLLEPGNLLHGIGSTPTILQLAAGTSFFAFFVVAAVTATAGTVAARGSRIVHDGSLYFLVFLIILGILNTYRNTSGTMTWEAARLIFLILIVFYMLIAWLSPSVTAKFDQRPQRERQRTQGIAMMLLIAVLLVAPQFMGSYISNVFNLIALYAMMGIGLNVMIGYTGLLDLGYVASFAIGAYTLGILTTPNLLTCGGVHPDDLLDYQINLRSDDALVTSFNTLNITTNTNFVVLDTTAVTQSAAVLPAAARPLAQIALPQTSVRTNEVTLGQQVNQQLLAVTAIDNVCTGRVNFWVAWPFCVLFSAITGMLLGIPVLRLRGDYLAIVTLGFGEITNRVILSDQFEPLLGGAQGISPIPIPTIDLTGFNDAWIDQLNSSASIYYLFLFGTILTAFVVYRLANSRSGRAMRAVRADEDVAEAMGINLIRTKLLAFGVSSAFAGLGGAVFAASVQGIFPNSFTLFVSINVLSLIIIGGMGSIPGVIIGAILLVGLPELLRELETYRLLAFGALLVVVMITRPSGLLPPQPPRLAERAAQFVAKDESDG